MSFIKWYEEWLINSDINGLPTLEIAFNGGREYEFNKLNQKILELEKELIEVKENAEIQLKRAEKADFDYWIVKQRSDKVESDREELLRLNKENNKQYLECVEERNKYRLALEKISVLQLDFQMRTTALGALDEKKI